MEQQQNARTYRSLSWPLFYLAKKMGMIQLNYYKKTQS